MSDCIITLGIDARSVHLSGGDGFGSGLQEPSLPAAEQSV